VTSKNGAESFDQLVGAGEQCRWHGQPKHSRGGTVDDQLEFGRLHDRQVLRLGALEDAASIGSNLAIRIS